MILLQKGAFINSSSVNYSLGEEQHAFSSDFTLDEFLNHDGYCKSPSG
jgi:hypothetical protein